MKKILRRDEELILEELEDIPDIELPKVLEIIRYLKVGIHSSQKEEYPPPHRLHHLVEMDEDSNGRSEKGLEHPTPYFKTKQTSE
ncbi:MAG: hypothetical protein IEMM0008_1517 [bacterium]|nr:MAG: hypothetical protein IEMM0008_1517 [bacterium]